MQSPECHCRAHHARQIERGAPFGFLTSVMEWIARHSVSPNLPLCLQVRENNKIELASTTVLALPLEEVSAKVLCT